MYECILAYVFTLIFHVYITRHAFFNGTLGNLFPAKLLLKSKSNQIFSKPKIRGPWRAYKYNTKKINTHTHTFRLYNDYNDLYIYIM
jgi:hypothetical protein